MGAAVQGHHGPVEGQIISLHNWWKCSYKESAKKTVKKKLQNVPFEWGGWQAIWAMPIWTWASFSCAKFVPKSMFSMSAILWSELPSRGLKPDDAHNNELSEQHYNDWIDDSVKFLHWCIMMMMNMVLNDDHAVHNDDPMTRLMLMLMLWPLTPGVRNVGTYHRPSDGHFYELCPLKVYLFVR